MTDQERLSGYVDVWWRAVDDFTSLLEQLPAEEWSTPTDLAGWDVRAVAAHATGWLTATFDTAPGDLARLIEVLDRHCEAVGRDPATLRRGAASISVRAFRSSCPRCIRATAARSSIA